PVDEAGVVLVEVVAMPFVEVGHAVAAIHLDDGGDEGDDVVADELVVGAFIPGDAVGELHQGSGGAGFGGMNGAGDVIDRHGLAGDLLGAGVVKLDGARVGQLGEQGGILLELGEVGLGGDGDGDHFAPLFAVANGEDAHARRSRSQHAHVPVDEGRVGQDVGRAGDVAEDGFGGGNRGRGGEVIDERGAKVGLGGVLEDLGGVGLVNGHARGGTGEDGGRGGGGLLRGKGGGEEEGGGGRKRDLIHMHGNAPKSDAGPL